MVKGTIRSDLDLELALNVRAEVVQEHQALFLEVVPVIG